MAFSGVSMIASPEPTACRSPTCSQIITTENNQAKGEVLTYFAQKVRGGCKPLFVNDNQAWARYLEGDNISTKIGSGRDRDRGGLPDLDRKSRSGFFFRLDLDFASRSGRPPRLISLMPDDNEPTLGRAVARRPVVRWSVAPDIRTTTPATRRASGRRRSNSASGWTSLRRRRWDWATRKTTPTTFAILWRPRPWLSSIIW